MSVINCIVAGSSLLAVVISVATLLQNNKIMRESNRGNIIMSFKQVGRYKVFSIKNVGASAVTIKKIKLSRDFTNRNIVADAEIFTHYKEELDKRWLEHYEDKIIDSSDSIINYINYNPDSELYKNGLIILIEYRDLYGKNHIAKHEIFNRWFEMSPGEINVSGKHASLSSLNATLNQRLLEINENIR